MIKIYTKDDTTAGGMAPPAVSIPSELAFSPAGCSITFKVCGISRTLTSFEAGGAIPLDFSASEMARVRRGVHFGELTIRDAYGRRYTVSSTIRVLFTDNLSEARDADYEQVDDSRQVLKAENIQDLPAEFTENELRAKLNEVLRFVRGGTTTLVLAVLACFSAFGVEVQTAPKGEIKNTAQVVTNVTGLADLATKEYVQSYVVDNVGVGGGGLTSTQVDERITTATNALAGAYATKGDVVAATNGITAASIGAQTALTPTQIGVVNGGPYLPTSGGDLTSSSSSGVGITLKGGVGEYYSGGDAEVKSGWEGNPASIVLNGGVYRGAILEVKDADDPSHPLSEKASIKKGGKEVATEDQVLSRTTFADATNIVTDAIASAPTTYTNVTGSAYVALNQSVQTITVNGSAITIGSMPTAVPGGTRDFVIYVNNTSATTDAPLSLPAGTYYGDDGATNSFTKGTVSALYLTEMSGGVFVIGRRELKQIVVQ